MLKYLYFSLRIKKFPSYYELFPFHKVFQHFKWIFKGVSTHFSHQGPWSELWFTTIFYGSLNMSKKPGWKYKLWSGIIYTPAVDPPQQPLDLWSTLALGGLPVLRPLKTWWGRGAPSTTWYPSCSSSPRLWDWDAVLQYCKSWGHISSQKLFT